MKDKPFNICIYCGKFIAYEDFTNGKATNINTLPESLVTNETWEAYHTKCKSLDIFKNKTIDMGKGVRSD